MNGQSRLLCFAMTKHCVHICRKSLPESRILGKDLESLPLCSVNEQVEQGMVEEATQLYYVSMPGRKEKIVLEMTENDH